MTKKKTEAHVEIVKAVENIEAVQVEKPIAVEEPAIIVEEPNRAEKEIHYIVTCSVNARTLPSLEGKVLYVLNPQDEVKIMGEFGDWYQISTDAFVMKQYIEKVEK